jgi:hypothetical protein
MMRPMPATFATPAPVGVEPQHLPGARLRQVVLRGALGLFGLLLVALAGLWFWLQSDHFRQTLATQASQALGVELEFGALGLSLRPLPALSVQQLRLKTQPPLTAERIELRPSLPALLAGRPALAAVTVQSAHLPQKGLDDLLQRRAARDKASSKTLSKQELLVGGSTEQNPQKAQKIAAPNDAAPDIGPLLDGSHWALNDIHWQGLAGQELRLDAQVSWGAALQPTHLAVTLRQLRMNGLADLGGTALTIRQIESTNPGTAVQYAVEATLRSGAAGSSRGRITGQLDWRVDGQQPPKPGLSVQGQFNTQGLDLRLLGKSTAQGLQPVLSGLLDAQTTLTVQAADVAGLVNALRTDSSFTVRQAVLHGMDLAKAVKTVGLSRGGNTPLDVLSGRLHSQALPKGQVLALTQLVARSGVLGATGDVTVSAPSGPTGQSAQSKLSGQLQVALGEQALPDAAKGIVGIPLQLGGTLESPELSLSRAAMIGAAVGTVLAPGAGTAAGANLGDKIGNKIKGFFGR